MVTSTPVISLIKRRMRYETMIKIKPPMAKVSVFLAPSKALGSPPEVINLKPEDKRRTKKVTPAIPKTIFTIFANTSSKF